MAYHSENGRYFLGCRTNRAGGLEVVFEIADTKRMIFNVLNVAPSEPVINAILKSALESTNVLEFLIEKTQEQHIAMELSAG